MENKGKNVINHTDGNNNQSLEAATWALGDQINTPTDHEASSGNLSDLRFDDDDDFYLLDSFYDEDLYLDTTLTFLDVIGEPSSDVLPQPDQPEAFVPAPAVGLEQEVNVHTPGDFSMISSSSNVPATQAQLTKQVAQEDKDKKQKKPVKTNNTSTKKPALPRYAFVTKSDIDVLDDGYKWRKYGQKAVSKSPFPRHYYRCTGEECGVVKRVERSSEDPSTVVTTYVGNHNHFRPVMEPRGNMGMSSKSYGFPESSSAAGGGNSGSGTGVSRASLSGGIGGNFSNGIGGGGGGGSLSSAIASIPKVEIVDNIGDIAMISTGFGGSSYGFPELSSGAGSGNFGSGTGVSRASLSNGIGGNFSNGIGGTGSFSYGMAGSMNGSFGSSFSNGTGNASGCIGGRLSISRGGGGFTYGLGGSNFISSGNRGASGSFSSAIASRPKVEIVDNIGGIGRIITDNGSFGSGGGGSSSYGTGNASGCIGGKLSSASRGGGFTYGLGGSNFTGSNNGGASGGGGFSSAIAISSKVEIVDNIGGIGMITGNAYNARAIRSNVVSAAAALAAPPPPTTTSSAAMGSGILSFENNDFYSLEMYEQLGRLRDQALHQNILPPPKMQKPKKRGRE